MGREEWVKEVWPQEKVRLLNSPSDLDFVSLWRWLRQRILRNTTTDPRRTSSDSATRSESPLPQPLTQEPRELDSACPDVIELDQRLSVADLRRMTKTMLIEALRDAELPFRSNEKKQVLLERMIVHVSGPDE